MTNDSQISDREREILRLVATGATNQQIAQQLQISINTVKGHLRNIFGKIGVVSRTEATVYAIRNGLVTVGEGPGVSVEEDVDEVAQPPSNGQSGEAAEQRHDQQPGSTLDLPTPDLSTAAVAITPPSALPAPPSRSRTVLPWLVAGLVLVLGAGLFFAPRLLAPAAPLAVNTAVAPAQSEPATRWFSRAPLPNPRSNFALAAFDLERELYVVGGRQDSAVSAEVDRYDPVSDLWVSLTDKPTAVSHSGAITLRGRIYVAGGEDASGTVRDILEIYDPRERRWERGPALPAPRSRQAMVAWEGRLYLIGGWDGSQICDEVYIFDPETEIWSEGPALLIPRRGAGAVVTGGRLYLIGGEGTDGPLRDSARLDPSNESPGSWSAIAPLPKPVARPAVVASVGKVLVFDAERREGLQYDQAADAWQSFAIPEEAVVAPSAAMLDASIYFVTDGDAPVPGAVGEYQAIYTVFLPTR